MSFKAGQKWEVTEAGCKDSGWPWTRKGEVFEVMYITQLGATMNSKKHTILADYELDILQDGLAELIKDVNE